MDFSLDEPKEKINEEFSFRPLSHIQMLIE